MATATAKGRIHYLDIAKGMGILLMIFGHIDRGGMVQTWIYSFHMPLFFLVSGMLAAKSQKPDGDFGTYLKKKAKGLGYPYLTMTLLTFVYIILWGLCRGETWGLIKGSLADCGVSTVMLWGHGNLWFIPCFFFSGCLFFWTKKKRFSGLLLGLLAALFCWWRYPEGNTQNSLDTVFLKSLIGCGLMTLGFEADALVKKLQSRWWALLLGAVAFFGGNALLFTLNGKSLADLNTVKVGNPLFYFAIAFCGAMGVVCLSALLEKWRLFEPFRFFGGGRRSLLFLAVNNFTAFATVSGKLVEKALGGAVSDGTYPYYLAEYLLVLLGEGLLVFLIDRFLLFLVDADALKRLFCSSKTRKKP